MTVVDSCGMACRSLLFSFTLPPSLPAVISLSRIKIPQNTQNFVLYTLSEPPIHCRIHKLRHSRCQDLTWAVASKHSSRSRRPTSMPIKSFQLTLASIPSALPGQVTAQEAARLLQCPSSLFWSSACSSGVEWSIKFVKLLQCSR